MSLGCNFLPLAMTLHRCSLIIQYTYSWKSNRQTLFKNWRWSLSGVYSIVVKTGSQDFTAEKKAWKSFQGRLFQQSANLRQYSFDSLTLSFDFWLQSNAILSDIHYTVVFRQKRGSKFCRLGDIIQQDSTFIPTPFHTLFDRVEHFWQKILASSKIWVKKIVVFNAFPSKSID